MQIPKIHKKHFYRNLFVIFVIISAIAGGSYVFATNYYSIQSAENQKRVEAETKQNVEAILAAKEAKRKEPVYISLPGAQTIRAIVDDYSDSDSIWKLVNKKNTLPVSYVPSPISIPNVSTRTDKSTDERSTRTDIGKALKSMFTQATDDGVSLMIGSGYRSAALQKIYFDSLASSVGAAAANVAIAYPGQIEHQTGLAVDITASSLKCYLDECFEGTNDGVWLANNSYKYGFILRYPKGKESITGYQYEPWHFRYVGVDLATALFESKLTLEEAQKYIQAAQDTLEENGAI